MPANPAILADIKKIIAAHPAHVRDHMDKFATDPNTTTLAEPAYLVLTTLRKIIKLATFDQVKEMVAAGLPVVKDITAADVRAALGTRAQASPAPTETPQGVKRALPAPEQSSRMEILRRRLADSFDDKKVCDLTAADAAGPPVPAAPPLNGLNLEMVTMLLDRGLPFGVRTTTVAEAMAMIAAHDAPK